MMQEKVGRRPRIRVAVALVEDDKLLLVEHSKQDRKYWLLPGGGVEWGEEARAAAYRELLEETGVEAEIGKLLLVSESVAPDRSRHLLHLVFSGRRLRTLGATLPEGERITDVRWIAIDELGELVFHPPIQDVLAALGSSGLKFAREDSVFLANSWVE